MQSKTSCCNGAVIRKNLTRFAPVWGAYILCLLMGIFLLLNDERLHSFSYEMTNLHKVMAVVNCGYALLVAQLLFGDLYASRSCYALHAMPLRRETWFASHVVSGLVFSLVPTFLMSVMATVLSVGTAVENGLLMPWYVFASANLQYLFFFGLAVLCCFFAGNRLGMIACYGVLNFGAFAIEIVIQALYAPMFFGVVYNDAAYIPFFPLGQMIESNLLEIPNYDTLMDAWYTAKKSYDLSLTFTTGDGWGYLAAMALVGLGFMAVGLLLYRKRNLEVAGDLLAVKILEPVFLVAAALACAYGFQMVRDEVTGSAYRDLPYLSKHGWFAFMAVGLAVGWYAARMLLKRSTRVFTKGSVPGLVVLGAVLALSFAGTAMDPLNVETRIPEASEVASVGLAQDTYFQSVKLEQPGDLEQIQKLHQMALDQRITDEVLRNSGEDDHFDRFAITYTLNNGSKVRRNYYVQTNTPAGELAKSLFTRSEVVLAGYDGEFDASKLETLEFSTDQGEKKFADPAELSSFLEAVRADCQAGTMAQNYSYHRNSGYFGKPDNERFVDECIRVNLKSEYRWTDLNIYPDSVNTLKWLEDRGLVQAMGYELMEGDYYERSQYISNKYYSENAG